MKTHLVTAATALSLGILGTLGAGGIAEVSAAAFDRKVTVSKDVPNTNPTIDQIWARLETAMCADAETEAGLSSGDCSVEPGTVVSFVRGAENTTVTATFLFAGTWAKGAPQ